jgi:hypothetical protein
METRENWVKTVVGAIVLAALLGVLWAWLFSCLITTFMQEDATFLSILPFGIAFGVLMTAIGVYLRTVPFKMVTESVTFDDREAFLFKVERALAKAGYASKAGSQSDDLRLFECAQSLDSLYKRNVTVQLAEDTATFVGPRASLKRVRKELQ